MTINKQTHTDTKWQLLTVEALNELFEPYTFVQRIEKLYELFEVKDVMATTSFGTHSAFLLYWLKKVKPEQGVYFVDTGYHFPETLEYGKTLQSLLNLEVKTLTPNAAEHALSEDNQWFQKDRELCCKVNKMAPLNAVKGNHMVWISGLMRFQTENRKQMRIFELQDGLLKFHPFIDLDEGEFHFLLGHQNLPEHPLKSLGFESIGCGHCTRRGKGRDGRWANSAKTECGLHEGYFIK